MTRRHWEHVERLKAAADDRVHMRNVEWMSPVVGVGLAALLLRLGGVNVLANPLAALSSPTPSVALALAFGGLLYGRHLAKGRVRAQSELERRVEAFARHVGRTPLCNCGVRCNHMEQFVLRAEKETGIQLYLHW